MGATLWIDVEDLFVYEAPRPSGIQRLAFEIYCALQAQYADSGRVRFVRHDLTQNSFSDVEWAEVVMLFRGLAESEPVLAEQTESEPVLVKQTESEPVAVLSPPVILPRFPARQLIRRLAHRLPTALLDATVDALVAQKHALRSWIRLLAEMYRCTFRLPLWPIRYCREEKMNAVAPKPDIDAATPAPDIKAVAPVHDKNAAGPEADYTNTVTPSFASRVAPGDIILVLGAPWSHPDYASLIRQHQERLGIRFAMLVYDLIPLRRPEWCVLGVVHLFRSWFTGLLPLCDHIFTISQATAADVESYASEQGVVLRCPVLPIPIGSSFGKAPAATMVQRTSRLPPPGSYALVVSTIEARKNHLLLFRVWRALLEGSARDRVPALVFAGHIGWLVQDLMQQIANTENLGGKLILVEDPTDTELVALYQGCLFTLCASFYEGRGLPVTESLGFGKPCVVSNRASLLEAGVGLVRSFDPDNLHDALEVIWNLVNHRADLAQWEARVRREFKPVPWSASVEAIITSLDRTAARSGVAIPAPAPPVSPHPEIASVQSGAPTQN
jgi:glycosyltransferase involved in cell wall biosynthesis